jgi:hypothetical protein
MPSRILITSAKVLSTFAGARLDGKTFPLAHADQISIGLCFSREETPHSAISVVPPVE